MWGLLGDSSNQPLVVACREHRHNDCLRKNLLLDPEDRSWSARKKLSMNTVNTSQAHQFIQAIGLLEDLEPRAAEPSLRVVPIPTLREFAGAFEDVEELAEEGLFPSTESSSSKILSAKKPHAAVNQMKQRDVPRNTNGKHATFSSLLCQPSSQQCPHARNPVSHRIPPAHWTQSFAIAPTIL